MFVSSCNPYSHSGAGQAYCKYTFLCTRLYRPSPIHSDTFQRSKSHESLKDRHGNNYNAYLSDTNARSGVLS